MTTGSDAPQQEKMTKKFMIRSSLQNKDRYFIILLQTTKPKKSRSKRQREANSEFLVDFGKLTLPTMKRYKRSVDPNYEGKTLCFPKNK